ncbi:hypothetical protein BBJ28_00013629 [Nothophytophthora sp. Chile5]|nr:hypothetical protein BBJ28_00013629 [Nothophytophthora sp. Chile5]
MLSDKQFLLWFLPLALTTFISGPLAVLHSFDLLEPATCSLSLPRFGFKSADINDALLPEEIPLMFQMERYPATGRKTVEVRDLRLMNLTSFASMQSPSSQEAPSTALLGYISIAETAEQQEKDPSGYPEGDLLLITKISFSGFDDEAEQHELIELESHRARRFRLKTVRHDESTGLLFGRVEWIADDDQVVK